VEVPPGGSQGDGDGVIELYNSKFANPGLAFMKLPKENGPVTEVQFDEDVEWTWWEIWHD
jgi:hypothetical protein